ncbi:MAG: hypothetical protein JJU36_01525 [Phycisphaeraceae bacterium]|nr:hypothetical protein [Phycisphaeraceae bacterium]
MKPSLEQLAAACPRIPDDRVRRHLDHLDDDYFEQFSLEDAARHLELLDRIRPDQPCQVITESSDGREFACTVVAADSPFAFSLITGVMAGLGMAIHAGEVYTYRSEPPPPPPESLPPPEPPPEPERDRDRALSSGPASQHPGGRVRPVPSIRSSLRRGTGPGKPAQRSVSTRWIIDQFRGSLRPRRGATPWDHELEARLLEVFKGLASAEDRATERARQKVNEWVVAAQLRDGPSDLTAMLPVDLRIDLSPEGRNRVRIRAQDTPAFLYTLSTALSLQKLSIERVRIRTLSHAVEDEIHFVDSRGRAIEDPARLDRIRFLALLTKQFSHFLYRAPNPHRALGRFGEMVEDLLSHTSSGRQAWLDMLKSPEALGKLARLLGASDYLWEDFIRSQYESLMPLLGGSTWMDTGQPAHPDSNIARLREASPTTDARAKPAQRSEDRQQPLCAPGEALGRLLAEALRGAVGLAEQGDRLNRFKDRHTFLIDLDQILNPATDFAAFSLRLTQLAEVLIRAAFACVQRDLEANYGRPCQQDGQPAGWAAFGLGKLGGQALGYASDLELLVIYAGAGRTTGGKRGKMDNAQFFELLVRDATAMIRSRREGIFSVDLRLRPHGKDGPLAASLDSFGRYYGPGGPAHAAERLALVRLRPVAESLGRQAADEPIEPDRLAPAPEGLGAKVQALRDRLIYELGLVSSQEVWALRRRQFAQKAGGRRLDAKYACGGLVDLEYTVQLLQARFGGRYEELRTAGIRRALEALGELKVIDREEATGLTLAYAFYRRLINALRMLRGSARDLQLPDEGSDEMVHLARRMGYRQRGWVGPERYLPLDLGVHAAVVRSFVERHFGRDSLPLPTTGSPADIVLSQSLTPQDRDAILDQMGFEDTDAMAWRLARLAKLDIDRSRLARLANLSCQTLRDEPEAVSKFALERLIGLLEAAAPAGAVVDALLEEPLRLEMVIHWLGGRESALDQLLALEDRLPAKLRSLEPESLLGGEMPAAEELDELIHSRLQSNADEPT